MADTVRILVEAFGRTLLDVRLLDRDDPEPSAPEHISIGFSTTERSTPYVEPESISEGVEWRKR